jgi:hypothetical protein
MGQSSYVYILWLVILVAGLWLIIGFGSLLHAREDLAGEWELRPESPASNLQATSMRVEQSGRYLKITLGDGKTLKMKMVDESIIDQRFAEHKRVTLQGDDAQARFEGRASGDLWRLSLDGSVRGDYIARLTDRTYPKPAPTTRKASEALLHAR